MNESRHNPFESNPASGGHVRPTAPERADDFEFALMQSSANLNPIDEEVVDIDSLSREFDSLMARSAAEFSASPTAPRTVEAEPQRATAPADIEVNPLPAAVSPMAETPLAAGEPHTSEQPIEIDTAEAHAASASASSEGAATVDASENAQLVAGAAEPLKSVDESLARNIDEMLRTDAAAVGGVAESVQPGVEASHVDASATDQSGAALMEQSIATSDQAQSSPAAPDSSTPIHSPPMADAAATLNPASAATFQGLAAVTPAANNADAPPGPVVAAVPVPAAPVAPQPRAPESNPSLPAHSFQQVVVPQTGGLKQVVVAALLLLNLPFRFVPRALLPAMNLVAITLALWVPVVWFALPMLVKHDPPSQVVDEMHHQSMLRVEPENRAATSSGSTGSLKSGAH